MKMCPRCGREYDVSMIFCLDDGTELLYGPSSTDEPATAILSEQRVLAGGAPTGRNTVHEPVTASSSATSRDNNLASESAILQRSTTDEGSDSSRAVGHSSSRSAKPVIGLAVLVLMVIGGFLGYRYLSSSVKQIDSIAVMPFVNESGDSNVDYLS